MSGNAELTLRLAWATGMLRGLSRGAEADAGTLRALARAGLDMASADEHALSDAGNDEALASLAEARAQDAASAFIAEHNALSQALGEGE